MEQIDGFILTYSADYNEKWLHKIILQWILSIWIIATIRNWGDVCVLGV